MDVRGFVVDAQYRIEGSTSYVMLYGRLEDGRSFATRNAYEPYFAIRACDQERAATLLEERARIETSDLLGPDGEATVRVIARSPKDVPDLRASLEREDITCFEADIRFVRRFLIDHRIRGDVHIRGAAREHERADLFFEEPSVTGCERTDTTLRVMSIDIETSADATTEDPPNTGDGVVESLEDPEEFLPADSSRPEERPFESDEPGAAAATEGSRAAGDDAAEPDTDAASGTVVPGDDQGEASAADGARAVVRCHFCGRPIFPP